MIKRLAIACLIVASPAFGQQAVDPYIGTWKLNVQKSTSTLPFTRIQTLTWSGEGQNFINTNEGVTAQGQPYKVIFRHIYDGQPHPTTGAANYDSTAYNRIGNTINWVRYRQGKAVEVGQGVIAPANTYTITSEGIDANNQPYHGVYVYDRQ